MYIPAYLSTLLQTFLTKFARLRIMHDGESNDHPLRIYLVLCARVAYLTIYVRRYLPSCLSAYLFAFYLTTYLHIYAPNCLSWLKINYKTESD